jgi:2-polyprenyl-6-methoxyphenol hydroxylase-like FAD-dependent oxidoreductase
MRIAVVGAGVAGLATATLLARQGHGVTLLERQSLLPDARGGLLLQPCGLAVLARLGLLGEALNHGSRIRKLIRQHTSGVVTLELSYEAYRPGSHGLGITRGALTRLLAESASASGVTMQLGCRVTKLQELPAGVMLHTEAGEYPATFALVIVADGMRSMLRDHLNLPHTVQACPLGALSLTAPQPAAMARDSVRQVFRNGPDVIGWLPSGRDADGRECVTWFQNMPVAEYESPDRRPFGRWREQAIAVSAESRELLEPLAGFEALQFSRYAMVAMPRWHTKRCVVMGDAAHALDPLLGMGANMALADAAALADEMVGVDESTVSQALVAFQSRRQPQLSRYQRAGTILSPLLHAESPLSGLWPDAAIRTALRAPGVRQRVMAAISGELQ